MTHAQFRRSDQAQRGRAAADAARRCSSTTSSCPACCTSPSCAATSRTPASARIDVSRGARAAQGVVAVYTAEDLGGYWQPGPLLVPPPPIDGLDLQPAHAGAARQGQGAPRRRAARGRRGGEPLHRRGRARRYRGRSRAAAGGGRSGRGAERRHRRWCTRMSRANVAAHVRPDQGRLRRARAPRPIAIIARRFRYDRGASVADRDPRHRRQVGRARQSAHGLGHDAGADVRPQRPRRDARPERAAGARDRAVRRRRLRAEDHDVLPRGGGGPLGGAMQLNRPVKWIEDRLENFFATTQERGQIHDAEIALARDGRILGIKDVFLHDTGAYDPYGLTVPINSQCTLLGPYVVPNYDIDVHRRLHQQADRHALSRRRPPARRVRDRAAAGHRRARAWHRPRRDPPAQPHSARRVPLQQRDHLPGLRAARLRQRQLRAGARQGAGDDRLQGIPRARSSRGCAPQGRHVGIGIACYVEGTGIGPYEGARVQVQANGKVSVATGIGTQGQGHFTVLRADRCRPARRRCHRRRRRHRRHRSVLLGRRHLREPRRRGRRQRRQRSRARRCGRRC